MYYDLRKGDVPQSKYHLAIVGAGAAGISIAKEFAGSARSILLIESGGFEFERQTQDLYKGRVIGNILENDNYLESTRLRYFGGTTNHWAGWCRPLDEIDFKKREWVPHSGWPILKNDLEPYYREAEKLVGIESFQDLDGEQHNWSSTDTGMLKVRAPYFQVTRPPTKFGKQYRQDIVEAKNIDLLLNANLTDMRLAEGNRRVQNLQVTSLNRNRAEIRATVVILACGGIENARILLNCRKDVSAGIGNQNDQLGRYFMEHPQYWRATGLLVSWDSHPLNELWNFTKKWIREELNQPRLQRVFSITEEAQREQKLLNISFEIREVSKFSQFQFDHGEKSLAIALKDISNKLLMDKNILQKVSVSRIFIRAEQEPNATNRVQLIEEKDELGFQRVKLVCQVHDHEKQNYRESLQLLARALGIEKKARIRADLNVNSMVNKGSHHMGSTRMSSDPKTGVVDENCKVHGIDNLFIAGSSVFPTGGFANPTLTILALAVRLAGHVKALLEG